MKINYHLKFLEELEKIGDSKPSLLLHVCCGPCSSNIIQELKEKFTITIYYSNSNIYPSEEYTRRYQELVSFRDTFDDSIEIVEQEYRPIEYLNNISLYSNEPEGGKRCYLCYSLRMKDAKRYASKHQFDYWTTVLSVSPHKNSQWINEIGLAMDQGDSKFLCSDFKKDSGYLKSTRMASEYHMYRQSYCGCIYSYEDMLKREKK